MTDTEMKLMVNCIEVKIEEKLDNDLDSIKDLETLKKKLNIMIEKQTPYE
jgi:frataxin-like iron-binding protein CyaY